MHVETGSQFTVGLDDPVNPKGFLVEIDFKVNLAELETKKHLMTYETKCATQFEVIDFGGFTDLTALPPTALVPYFAMTHHLAMTRAELSLGAFGVRGVTLPRPEKFDGEIIPQQK